MTSLATIKQPYATPPTPRVVDVLLRYLKAEQADCVFGVPGGLLHPFFEAVERDHAFRLIVAKHEEGAAFMADGHARVSGKIAVCASTGGPGATNLLTGVAVAFADSVPLLVLTGQPPSRALGRGAAQEASAEDMDIVAMFRPITKYSAMVHTPESMSQHVRRALRKALCGRPGPVHLNVPVELWDKPVEEHWYEPRTYRSSTHTFDRKAVRDACELLFEAQHPVILVGSGVARSGAAQHVAALAEQLPARVATTPSAKGLFPEDDALSLGVLGTGGHTAARDTILSDRVDVLLTIGAALDQTTTLNWNPRFRPSRALIQIDIDADQIGRNYPVDVPLVGDAQTIAVELVYHAHRLLRDGRRPNSRWNEADPLPSGHDRHLNPELRTSDATPLTPQRWRWDLQQVLPANAIVLSDIGGHMLFNIQHLCIGAQQRWILNMGFASMGHGTCGAIGAALASPQTPVVAIIGDGCFAMNGMELLTAVEYGIKVIWIVENNNMHGISWHGSRMIGDGKALDCTRLRRPMDVAAIASSMGLQSWLVDSPGAMKQAFAAALACASPALIEVRVDPELPPPLSERAAMVKES